jgi:hypothetical protein
MPVGFPIMPRSGILGIPVNPLTLTLTIGLMFQMAGLTCWNGATAGGAVGNIVGAGKTVGKVFRRTVASGFDSGHGKFEKSLTPSGFPLKSSVGITIGSA